MYSLRSSVRIAVLALALLGNSKLMACPESEIQENGHVSTKALFEAVGRGDTAVVESALKDHSDPNLQYTDGESLLMRAINKGRMSVVQLLISNAADVNK